MTTLFQSLDQNQKIDFFIQCQKLMIKHHPGSSFIIREKNLNKALDSFCANINQYKGFVYSDANICVLWNHIFVEDPKNINKILTDNAYRPPNPAFNGVSIDFAVFRKMEESLLFIRQNYQPQIKHVLFIREGHPKLYDADAILKTIKF